MVWSDEQLVFACPDLVPDQVLSNHGRSRFCLDLSPDQILDTVYKTKFGLTLYDWYLDQTGFINRANISWPFLNNKMLNCQGWGITTQFKIRRINTTFNQMTYIFQNLENKYNTNWFFESHIHVQGILWCKHFLFKDQILMQTIYWFSLSNLKQEPNSCLSAKFSAW